MSMVKHKNLSRILVAILAVMTILAYSLPAGTSIAEAKDAPWPDGTVVKYVEGKKHKWIQDLNDSNKQFDAFCLNHEFNMSDWKGRSGYEKYWQRTFYDATNSSDPARVVIAVMNNKDIPSVNQYPETYQTADREQDAREQMKRALYYGFVGKQGDLGISSDEDYYLATQLAIWQIAHYGEGYMTGKYNTIQGAADYKGVGLIPESQAVQDAAMKLLLNYVFAMKQNTDGRWGYVYPEPPINLYVAYGKLLDSTVGVKDYSQNLIFGELTEPIEPVTKKYPVKVTKKILGGEELEGARIIVERNGEVVEQWTSQKTPTEISLEAGEYVMKETIAPDGYKRVTTEMRFTVGENGGVTLASATVDNGGKIQVMEGNHIVLENATEKEPEPTPEKGKLRTTVKAGGQEGTTAKAATLTAAQAGSVTEVVDTITYENLTAGATYNVTGTLMNITDNAVVKTVKEEKTAEAANGSWEIKFTGPEVKLEAGKTYVVYEEAVNKADDKDKAEHKDNSDKAQTIVVEKSEEPPVEKKTVKISKKALGGDEIEGATIKVTQGDKEVASWTSEKKAKELTLEPGKYVMEETSAPEGYKPVTTKVTFKVAADGKVTLETTMVDNGGKISVMDSNHIILEDAPDDALGTLKTTVTAGGKTASDEAEANLTVEEVAQAVPVTDKIDYEGLVGGATYSVTGTLMDVTNEGNPTDVATVENQECKADASGTGSWTMDFGKVELKPGRKYVVFEGAILTKDAKGEEVEKGDILTHMDVDDKAQTIIVEYESDLEAKKTTDVKTATVGDVIPFTITITNKGSGNAKDVKVTDYLGDYLQYVTDDKDGTPAGQNVHWTVDIPAGESYEIELECEVTEKAAGKIVNKVYVFDSTKPNAEPEEYEDEAKVAFNPPEDEDDNSKEGSDKKNKASNPTKVSTLARTSDEFNLGMWAVLMAISAFALAAAAMRRRYER